MLADEVATQRLHHQQLAAPAFANPSAVVGWLGAVQSQDYAGAKWALGQRTQGNVTDAALDQAFNRGAILRTHVLRPTWHFVTPADIRWMLALTAPRINAKLATYYRNLELDDAIFARSNAALTVALQGGQQLTRPQLTSVLAQSGIVTGDLLRITHLLIRAELDGIICSGGRQGKQFTYALLDERAPHAKPLDRDEALAELAKRYFTSHGPATLKDYVWWSGLTMSDAKVGLGLVEPQLVHEVIDGQSYWLAASAPLAEVGGPVVSLLSNYDEYIVGYTDRRAIFEPQHAPQLDERSNPLFMHTVVIDGQIAGTWKRTFTKNSVNVTFSPFTPWNEAQTKAVYVAAQRYAEFVGLSLSVNF